MKRPHLHLLIMDTFPAFDYITFDWASVDPSGEYIVYAQHAPHEITAVIPFSDAANAKSRSLLDFFVSDYYAHAKRGYDPEPQPGTAYLNLIELDQGL